MLIRHEIPVGCHKKKRIGIPALFFFLSITGNLFAQEAAEPETGIPAGETAIPVFNEIWEFSSNQIFPRELASRFDENSYNLIINDLHSGEVALADSLNPFLDELGISHTHFYDRRHQSYYMLRSLFSERDLNKPQLYTIGVLLDDNNPGYIDAVLDGTPASMAGLRRGERIIAVNGKPFESLQQWQNADQVKLVVNNSGQVREVQIQPQYKGFHRSLADASTASSTIYPCTDQKRVGYFHLWSGTHEVFLQSLYAAVSNAVKSDLDGFILDLRDGFGGAWWAYLDPFFANRDEYFTAVINNADGVSSLMQADQQNNQGAWTGRLAVLINNGTRSGKEALAYQFKKTGRAVLIGTNTAGAFTGGMGAFADREDGYILYLAVNELRIDGNKLEGIGVQPDITVVEKAGEEAPVAAALEYLGCG